MSRPPTSGLLVAMILTGVFTVLFVFGQLPLPMIVIFLLWVSLAYVFGWAARSEFERWLPGLASLAMVAKLIGSSLRYYVLVEIYNGSGDAGRYHFSAIDIAPIWRTLTAPEIELVGFGGEGTRFIAWLTGLLYAPYEPSMLGGFWIFAFMAFVGQFLLYLAFRRFAPNYRWKRYAILVFFWPTLVYWPSSIGKEAPLLLFIGLASWAASRLYEKYSLLWLPLIGGSIYVISLVRVHLAAVLAAGLVAPALLEKWKERPKVAFARILILVVGAAAAIPLSIALADEFGVGLDTLSAEDLDPVFSSVSYATSGGGSAVSGGVISSPLDIPAGTLKVLFRPLPHEARNLPMLLSSIEGTALLVLLGWQVRRIWRNRPLLRGNPYLLFCMIYTALFVWAWSAMLNLGILARQRSLVLPFVLALVAGLGWEEPEPGIHKGSELEYVRV